jgi:hypothetical protein
MRGLPPVLVWVGAGLALVAAPLCARAQGSCVPPPAGIVSWWAGDSNENDLTGGNNPIAVSGVSLVSGEVLDGFTFAMPYSYIYIAPVPNLANQQFTWVAWAKPNGIGPNDDQFGSKMITQNQDDYDDVIGLDWRHTPDDRFLFLFGSDSTEVIYSKDLFPPGKFHLVAGTYDGRTFRLYVDGKLEGSLKDRKTINYNNQDWVIGASGAAFNGAGFPRTWNGVVDEVQAFNVKLSESQLKAIYKAKHAGECKP